MRWLLDLAIALTRAWTAVYTRGLPTDVRAERREEIDSDLWHQQQLADLEREPVTGTAVQILVRVVLGVPADLLWRLDAASTSPITGRTSVNDTPIMRVALFAATLPLLFLVVGGVGYIFGGGDFNASVGHILYRVALLGCPLVALVGLWLCATMPKLGLGMVVAGALTTTAAYFWMAPIGVPLALAIIVFAIKRSGLSIWPFRGPRPSASGTA